jgi:hypothetical protein
VGNTGFPKRPLSIRPVDQSIAMLRSEQCITEGLGWPSGLLGTWPAAPQSTPPGVPRDTIIKMMQQFRSAGCSNLSVLETPLRQRGSCQESGGSCGCSWRISCAANLQLGVAEQIKTRLEEATSYINALNNPTLHEDHSCLHGPRFCIIHGTSWTCRASMLQIALAIRLRMSN